jgi:hypothetical protein
MSQWPDPSKPPQPAPMPAQPTYQSPYGYPPPGHGMPLMANPAQDLDHLRLLSIFHYIYGVLVMLFSSVFIVHIVMGRMMLDGTFGKASQGNAPPPELGWMFIGMGTTIVLLGWTLGILTIVSGRMLARRKARVFSLVIAGINCASIPIGTALGVFTFIVLMRESVARIYLDVKNTDSSAPR